MNPSSKTFSSLLSFYSSINSSSKTNGETIESPKEPKEPKEPFLTAEQHCKNIELLARELAYHRFCGTIAAHNNLNAQYLAKHNESIDSHSNFRLNSDGDCEKAYELAEKNKMLFKSEALEIYLKIAVIEDDAAFRKEIAKRINSIDTNEIVNPIASLEIY